jgi:hypothetical protein
MAWKGIVGKSFTPDGFAAYVAGLKFNAWRPRFIVCHNTSAPDTKTWQGWQARKPPISDEKWMQNLVGYYRDDQKWSSGPHLFVTPGAINVFSPLTGPGTHSPSWNAVSWGIETVGEFERDPFNGPVRTNLIAALAVLHAAAGLQPRPYELGVRGLHFHKEDPKTTHRSCPGRNMVKADLVTAVEAKIIEMHGGEHTVEKIRVVPPVRTGVVNADDLKVRSEASAKSPIVKALKKGAKINITGEARNGDTLWFATDGGFVSARYVDQSA